MAVRFVVLDLRALLEFPSYIKLSPRKREKEKETKRKGIECSKIEETKNTQIRQPHFAHAVDFTVKYLASGCQFSYRYLYGRLFVQHFKKSK